MFGVGLHFHLKDLLAVRSIAIPGAVGQSLVATILGTCLALGFGWSVGAGLVLGVAISVASTVVLMRLLIDHDRLSSVHGHVAVGWLIVEDILTVLVLVLLPALAAASSGGSGGLGSVAAALGVAVLKVAVLCALVVLVGARAIPWLLAHIARTRSRELFTLTILVVALAIATGASMRFGVSMALGAFLAGLVVGQSRVSHQAAADALPLRDAFAVLFFVSVGMLFDPKFVVDEPGLVLGTLAIILVGKPIAAVVIVLALRRPVRTALTVAVGLAQIGEFSFILAEQAHALDILPDEGHSVLVAGALFSITLNPLLFRAIAPLERWLRARNRVWGLLSRNAATGGESAGGAAAELDGDAGKIHAVVVGYGPVGQTLSRILRGFGIDPVVVELNVDTVSRIASAGHPAIYGDATRPEILRAAGIERARFLIVTLPDVAARIPVIIAARRLNPGLKVLVRAHYIGERELLEEVGATAVCYEEAEAAVALAGVLLREVGADRDGIEEEAKRIRDEFALGAPEPIAGPEAPRPALGRTEP